jgi:hypothetical protein
MLNDLRRVSGKPNLLFEIAGASIDKPDGTVREVVFPVVGEQILRDLVKEGKATGPAYRTTLRTVIRNSYKGHYRRMVPQILDKLEFRSNNEHHRPVIQALDLLKRHAGSKLTLFPAEETVPTEGIVRGLWRDATLEKDAEGRKRVNRITYEICVLEALRNRLRCKEIWVVGANRYRNPDEDLPTDFEAQRTSYYQALDLLLLSGARPAPRGRSLHHHRSGGHAHGAGKARCRPAGQPAGPDHRQTRRFDHGHALRAAARTAEPDGTEGRDHHDLADDQPARHGQGDRSAPGLLRSLEEPHGL